MAKYTVADGAAFYDRLADYCHEASGFNRHNRIEITGVKRGWCEAVVDLEETSLNPLGVAHGGLTFAMGDVCSGVAAISATGRRALTQNASINYLRPGTGTRLTAVAREVKSGKHVGVYDVETFDDNGKMTSKGTFTMFLLDEIVIEE